MNLNHFDQITEFLHSSNEQDCLIHIHRILDALNFKPNLSLNQSFNDVRRSYRELRQKINYRAFIKIEDVAVKQEGDKASSLIKKLDASHFNHSFSDKFFSFNKSHTEGYDYLSSLDTLRREIALEPIFIPKTDKLMSNETRHYFKSQMIACQDLFAAQDFRGIYSICVYLKKESEPESAQLYQYLLLSYYETCGGAIEIVKEALSGNLEKLKHVWHFANRSLRLNESQNKSDTHGKLVTLLYTDLIHEMNLQYQNNIPFDYILPNNENESYRQQIWQYIDIGTEMLQYIPTPSRPIIDYCKNVLNEITGGGKLNWLDIGYQWYVRNAFFYPAIEKRKQIIETLETHSLWSNAFQKEINDILYLNLIEKYKRIGILESDSFRIEKRQQTHRFIKAAKNAYCLLNDKRFLFLCADELRGRGKFAWFELNDKDEIENLKICTELQSYQPKLDLRRIVQEIGSESDSIEHIEEEILKLLTEAQKYEITRQMIKDADTLYAECCQRDDKLTNPQVRQDIIHVLYKWRIAYAEFKDENLIEKCIDELKGKSGLSWFKLNLETKILDNHSSCIAVGYDSLHFLNDLRSKKDKTEQDSISNDLRIKIAENDAKDVKIEYDELKKNMIPEFHDSSESRTLIRTCFNKWDFYYNFCFKRELIDWSVNELVGEEIFSWFVFNTEGVLQPKTEGDEEWLNKSVVNFNKQNDSKIYFNDLLDRSKKSAFIELEKDIDLGLSIESSARREKVIQTIILCFKGWCNNEQNGEFIRIAKKTMCADNHVIWAIKAHLDKTFVIESLPSIMQSLSSVSDEFLSYILADVEIPDLKAFKNYVKGEEPKLANENNDWHNYAIIISISIVFVLFCVLFANYKHETTINYLIFTGCVIVAISIYLGYTIYTNSKRT